MPDPLPAAPAQPPGPAELLIVDTVVEHRIATSSGSGAFTFISTPGLLRDLTGFLGGSLHQRLEIRSKPTDAPILYQICLVPEDISIRPACSDASDLSVSGAGRYVADQPIAALEGIGALDLRRGLVQAMLVIRRPDGTPIDDRLHTAGGERVTFDADDYYPMTVHYSAVIVPPGTDFSGWP